MGMDLKPVSPSADAPKEDDGSYVWGRYNWSGWRWLNEKLDEWGVDTSDFAGTNDGQLIPKEICEEVADAIEEHLPELPEDEQAWLQPHIARWRTCGGYLQY